MTGTHLFDRLSHEDSRPAADERVLPRLAEQMVASAIASGKMLRDLRERLFPLEQEPGAVAIAQALRAEFQEWIADAESTYSRAHQLEEAGEIVPRAGELRDLIGLTTAMLQITLEKHFRSMESPAVRTSIEGLRRELHLKHGA